MSKIEAQLIKSSRPSGFRGKIDRYLGKTAADLRRKIIQTQRDFDSRKCQLEPELASKIAVICVEFAEDIHRN